jgi:acyl-CoA synthetase (AMP-forming)/AMP-acid ligase II/thioesterase domain-containing protein/acyl carrier protein
MLVRPTISSVIADHAARDPTALALLAPERQSLTYGRLHAEIQKHAHALIAIGIGQEDRVAVLLPNGPEQALSFLAISAIAACAPLNVTLTDNEFGAALSNLKPKALITAPDLDVRKRALAAKHGINVVTATSVLEREAGIFTLSASAVARGASDARSQSDDVALLLHTSGTTSRPKLVGLTHAHLCRSAENITRALQLSPMDRCLNIMPLFHIHGIVAGILSPLYAGASVVCSPRFQGRLFFPWLQQFQPSWYTAVPTMHAAIAARASQHEDVLKSHSLRFIRSCSAALPKSVQLDLERRFGIPVLEAYGMTEASHQIACNPLPPAIRKPGSVGVATGTEIAIFDQQGQPLGPDCEGEIVIRGGSVISCYVDNQSTDMEGFTGNWFRTGDIGLIDHDGYLFIKGRTKEIINRGGMKISPYEVEEVLLDHPNVAEAVAFAIPDWRLGEEVGAAVVLRRPSRMTAMEIRNFASRQLGDFKIPRELVFLDEIPKGPTGKLQRVGLAAKLGLVATPRAKHQVDVTHESHTRLQDLLATMWARIIGVERVGPHDNFFEIGGDSLAAMEFIAGIEQVTGKSLTIAALFEAPTIKQLVAFIEQEHPGWLPYVVPLQGKGSRPPFFCVGAGPGYLSLAQHLGTDQPFLGLLHPSNSLPSGVTIQAVAEFSVKSIRAVQPEGPYFIGGWCTDGLIAYEIAQQLRAQGQEVALLVLFDSVNPGRLDKLSAMHVIFVRADELFRKIWFHLRTMTWLEFGDLPDYFLERVKNAWHTLTRRTGLSRAAAKIVHPILAYQLPNMYLASLRYRPMPYHGRVLLFRRSLRAVSRYLDVKHGWSSLITGEFNVVEIQGGHSDMFCEPQVQCTAAELARACEICNPAENRNKADHRNSGLARTKAAV